MVMEMMHMPARTASQRHNNVRSTDPTVPVTQQDMQAAFHTAIMPYIGEHVTVQLITGKRGGHSTIEQGVIEVETTQGFVLRVIGHSGHWTTFINWVDLWTMHVRFETPGPRDAVDTARHWLQQHATQPVIDLMAMREVYGLDAIV